VTEVDPRPVRTRSGDERKSQRGGFRGLIYVSTPAIVLLVLFVGPLVVLLEMSLRRFSISGVDGFAGLTNYLTVLQDPSYPRVVLNTVLVASVSMGVMLFLAIPLAYLLAFRVGKLELPGLLLLVLADQLNPIIRVYAWRLLLGREGIINSFLQAIGLIQHPLDVLLFSKTAIIIVLSASYLSYTTLPIYAALKAVDPNLLEAAEDLGAGFISKLRKILIPLAIPGIFVAMILVFIPMLSEFVTPALVGGTSGYLLGNAIETQVLEVGNWGVGSAMSFLLLLLTVLLAAVSYKFAGLQRLETAR
jgi:ABC-type spermidine/putrescine transport system permease subunit I